MTYRAEEILVGSRTLLVEHGIRGVLSADGNSSDAASEVYVARAHEKFDGEGRLTDEPTRKIVRQLLESFAAWMPRFPAAGPPASS